MSSYSEKKSKRAGAETQATVIPTKGERTRRTLLDAAATCMERSGSNAMTIADVCREAKVSIGTFYIYFSDKHTLTVEVARDVIATVGSNVPETSREADPYKAILSATSRYVTLAAARPGLTRAIIRLCDDDVQLAALLHSENRRWVQKVATDLQRRTRADVDARTRMFAAYAMASMVDGLLRLLHVERDPHVRSAVRTSRELAEGLATLWYRAVYGANPPSPIGGVGARITRLRLAPTEKSKGSATRLKGRKGQHVQDN